MKEQKKTLLWRLDAADLPGPSYLFGTMHVRDRRVFQRLEVVRECILRCEAFATEFNLEEAALAFDPSRLRLPHGRTLDELLPSHRYDKLRGILLRAVGLDLNLLRHFVPILVVNFVDERMLVRDMPFALDEMLWRFAREHDKHLFGIETYAEQLRVLEHIPLKKQLQALLALGRNISRHRQHLLHMTQLYEQGEIQRLYQSARRGAGSLRRAMLYERNDLMAHRIAAAARERTAVFAVGAGHLAGAKGVLRLLKQEGLEVRPEVW